MPNCGSDSDDQPLDSFPPRVADVRVDPDSIAVGEQALVRLLVEPFIEETVDFDGDSISRPLGAVVVVKLPEGLDYVANTSAVDFSVFDGFEARNPNTIEICSDNSRALTYVIEGDNFSENVDNQIRFNIQSYEARGTVLIEAYASNFIDEPCAVIGEAVESLTLGSAP